MLIGLYFMDVSLFSNISALLCPRDAKHASCLKKKILHLMLVYSLYRIMSSIHIVMSVPFGTPPWLGLHSVLPLAVPSCPYRPGSEPHPYPDSSSFTLQCLYTFTLPAHLFPCFLTQNPCASETSPTSSICENWGLMLFTCLNHSACVPQLCGWQGTPSLWWGSLPEYCLIGLNWRFPQLTASFLDSIDVVEWLTEPRKPINSLDHQFMMKGIPRWKRGRGKV